MMTPYYADDWLTIYSGDARTVMATMPADSVDCVVTSPPYWGLRDYGHDGQLGLERTPEEYVANMVAVFAEVRRVLKPTGTCWLNLGDSYAAGGGSGEQRLDELGVRMGTGGGKKHSSRPSGRAPSAGLAQKQLVGIPWRVAFALQADGWYLRSDIIWSKPNPMPESVTDRPTKSHEYLFLLTKSARYFFDADAVREPSEMTPQNRHTNGRGGKDDGYAAHRKAPGMTSPTGRNIRSVWTIATRPYPGTHFAVFPPELPERCIKAGSSEKGVCPECGAPWERIVKVTGIEVARGNEPHLARQPGNSPDRDIPTHYKPDRETLGWKPRCDPNGYYERHVLDDPRPTPAVILDPFAGSGTTGMVAQKLGRRAVLIDLNPDYLKQQFARNAQTPLGLTQGDAA